MSFLIVINYYFLCKNFYSFYFLIFGFFRCILYGKKKHRILQSLQAKNLGFHHIIIITRSKNLEQIYKKKKLPH